ncbi:hypothetical protein SAMN05444274_10523 [Mariniphaga anaerophila]|uniref:Acetyltransferase (GNAT) domain-containing protein n=1 Tax=Mariniphaga anaerophila TaxID=1484053 RepID=A0A1M5B871_9BACT|nr:hypothetical protein [Mariniphaga anaerophila]SHF38679.1 hypothetical protein SAMN05444274_10523 [Mariniphaga anaerophila]
MKVREITVGELPAFIRSDEYAGLQPKPISPLRAISQAKNPDARDEDVALVFAAEKNTLLAFAGILPHRAKGVDAPVFSNSGWWVHPQLGRKFGLPVFLKAFQFCERRMFLTDSTAHTKSILERTGLFTMDPEVKGSRFFLRFYLGNLLRRKGKNRVLSGFFSAADSIFNIAVDLRFSFFFKKSHLKAYSLNAVERLDEQHLLFIEKHPGNSFLRQNTEKLNWVVQYPWVACNAPEDEIEYPFTYHVAHFRQEFLEVKRDNELVALLLLSVRDKHASIPFIYCTEGVLADVAHLLWKHLFQMKANSLVVFNTELEKAFRNSGRKWLLRKEIIRFAGYSNELKPIFSEKEYAFQDGDGDVAFT